MIDLVDAKENRFMMTSIIKPATPEMLRRLHIMYARLCFLEAHDTNPLQVIHLKSQSRRAFRHASVPREKANDLLKTWRNRKMSNYQDLGDLDD